MSKDKKPLSREAVLRMIAEHGGPQRLDLIGRNLEGIDLSPGADGEPVDLHGAVLSDANLQGAVLVEANLQGAFLLYADLQEAYLRDANLQGSRLGSANMQGADLSDTNLQGSRLWYADLREASLLGANMQGAGLRRANMQEAFLPNANLQGAELLYANIKGAELDDADLQGAALRAADLQGARLVRADLKGADLTRANLQVADLWGANLQEARLYDCDLRSARLEGVKWGPSYKSGEELAYEREKDAQRRRELIDQATSAYRHLKQRHTEAGMYDIAGQFYYREMEARRKARSWGRRDFWSKLGLWLMRLLCGYGERPLRVVGSAAVVVFVMAALYSASALYFPGALYFSAASFTALGYGLWVTAPAGWVRALGAFESFIGVFMMALFLITFVRKMTR